jgi:hypothetical protein
MFASLFRTVRPAASGVVTAVALTVLTLASSSCAKHPAPNPDAATHAITIQIDNNVIPTFVFTIWIREGNGGARTQLGTAPGSQSTTLTFTPRMFGMQYTLEAQPPLGTTIKRGLSIDNESITMLKWDLKNNVLSYFGNN